MEKAKTKQKRVMIYTTPFCIWCRRAKEFFRENKIPFKEIDVSSNKEKAEEMVKKSGQMGVPVIDIGGKIIVGFDQEAIDEELGLN